MLHILFQKQNYTSSTYCSNFVYFKMYKHVTDKKQLKQQ